MNIMANTRFFVPRTQLQDLTIGKMYPIEYTQEGRQIKDDKGENRIVHPLPSELWVE